MRVSDISLGAFASASERGPVSDKESYAALNGAIDLRSNFLDAADAYGDGRSERLVGKLLEECQRRDRRRHQAAGRRLEAPPPRVITTTRHVRPEVHHFR